MPDTTPPLRTSAVLNNWLPQASPFVTGILGRALGVDRLVEVYTRAEAGPESSFFQALLDQVGARIELEGAEENIPGEGPVVVVANHPFGMLDGVGLGALLARRRPGAKLLASRMLGIAPAFERHCIFVDPFQSAQATAFNSRPLREAWRLLRGGGLLGVFPAGEVAAWNPARHGVVDPEWNPSVAALIRRTGAAVVPVYFDGANSVPFHVLGLLHPFLRTANLANEFLNKSGRTVRLRVGSPVAARTLEGFSTDEEAIAYLRWRTELLAHRDAPARRAAGGRGAQAAIAASIPAESLRRELDALPACCVIERTQGWRTVMVEPAAAPLLMREIGRAREETFRAAGEGTGNDTDLDEFDPHYRQLVLWNEADQAVAGGYRLGETARLLAGRGIRGLYTSTLFRYQPQFFSAIGPALELGRSFVRPRYQKQYAPLLLLWKGIGKWVARHPEMPVLFGAVSMSNEYTEASRRMVVEYCAAQGAKDPLARMVRPRRGFRPLSRRHFDIGGLRRFVRTVEDLEAPMADLEADGKGVPVLLRQYSKLGGRLLGFHVDARFSDTLDGLILVDLRKAERRALDRYLTPAGAGALLNYHKWRPRQAG